MSDKLDLNKLHFVHLWYSPEIDCIEKFIEAAHANEHIKFERSGDGSGSDADKVSVSEDATKLRQNIVRYVCGNADRTQRDSLSQFHYKEPFVKWEARDKAQKNFRWHVRRLPKRDQLETNTPSKRANQDAFFEHFGNDTVVSW